VDKDGSFHIQLCQLYKKVGDQKDAELALWEGQVFLEQQEEASRANINSVQ
jgi:hypothetical protein